MNFFPQVTHRYCALHIIRNCHKRGEGINDRELWNLIKAPTRALFEDLMVKFRTKFPITSDYIDNIDHDMFMTYRFVENEDLTFGRKTSNISEQENSSSGILAEVRTLGPLRGLIDMASTRLVNILFYFDRIKQTNHDLGSMPTHFFKK